MKPIFLTLILMFSALPLVAQQAALPALSESPHGRRVLAYFAAFNSGNEQQLKDFFLENIAAEALQKRPVEPRLEFHRRIRNDFKTLEIKKVLSISESEIKLLAASPAGQWVAYSFLFENRPPQKFLGFAIEATDEPQPDEKRVSTEPLTKPAFLAKVESFLDETVRADKFSGVVLVAQKDRPVFSKAYGLADRESKRPNTPETKFNLGSINKIFTKIAIGQLVQKGKISYDDKLGKFLPDYPNREAREKITVRQLVSMTSGIGDFFGDKFVAMKKDKLRKNSDFIPLFAGEPLAFEPGTKNQYSNGGYILLGAIIEQVSGMSYYEYVRENIFKPAGMTDTESFESDNMPENTASGYTTRNAKNERLNNFETRPFRGSAAGGGYSNAPDLLKFSLALQTGKLTIPDDNGQPLKQIGTGIAGGADGINALFIVNGQTGYTVIVLSNYDPPSAEQVGTRIRDWLKQVQE